MSTHTASYDLAEAHTLTASQTVIIDGTPATIARVTHLGDITSVKFHDGASAMYRRTALVTVSA